MALQNFVGLNHTSTSRDYLARVTQRDKGEVAELAVKFDRDYWDGSRETGYGGYRYDGRWLKVAQKMVEVYGIKPGMSILDVGCGKGFLLHDLKRAVPDLRIAGLDVSSYAIEHAMEDVRPYLQQGHAAKLPFKDAEFDLVLSITTLHNLYNYDLISALREIERVSRRSKYICVEAYRTEREKVNLMYWQLTCRAFHTPAEWDFVMATAGYTGDFEFIFFE